MEVYYEKKNLFAAAAVSLIWQPDAGPSPLLSRFLPQKKRFHTVSESADTPSAEASSADTDAKTSSITGTIDEIKDLCLT